MPAKPVLAYWDTRGLAQPIRLMLKYTGTEFDDKQYVCGDAPFYDLTSWTNDKTKLQKDLQFPNLPYYMDGDVKITQSNAILRYIARKNGMLRGDMEPVKVAMIDMLEGELCDWRSSFATLCYSTYTEQKETYKTETLQRRLTLLSSSLKQAGDQWLLGKEMAHVDFIFFELLSQHLAFDPECLDKHQNLKAYHDRFKKLPAISKYLDSPECITKKINNRMAKFGA